EDALIAADDSRAAFAKRGRPAPWRLDKRIKPLVKIKGRSSFAPADAAIAGAAEVVLPYLFPNEPASTFTALATESLRAQMIAGIAYPSDLVQARALGHQVAQLALTHGDSDNHGVSGFSEGPFLGDQFWEPTPLAYEPGVGGAVGLWKPWLVPKYHYWQVRPITAIWRLSADRTHVYTEAQLAADPSLAPLRNVWTPFIPTPPFPAYPAGHPTFSGDAAKVLTYFFPKAGETLNQL